MKKKFSLFLICMLMFICMNVSVKAASKKAVGYIYSTDVLTYIDDMPIVAYNMDSKTLVAINDLSKYGFKVSWSSNSHAYLDMKQKPKKSSGMQSNTKETRKKIGQSL